MAPSQQTPKKNYVVMIFGWDLIKLPAFAAGVSEFLGLPSHYLHVGVAAFNRLYHVGQNGIVINFSMPKRYKILHGDDAEFNHSVTQKTRHEFDDWCEQQRLSNSFGVSTYDVNNKNCICFARAACEFLGVPFEGPQVTLQNWLEREGNMLSQAWIDSLRSNPILGALSSSSGSSCRGSGKASSVDVRETVVEMFYVNDAMEKFFKISQSGARYDKEDASVVAK